jgi:WD40 repeat protein
VVVDQVEVQLFDLRAGRPLGRLRTPREARMSSLAFSRDGSKLAAGTTQGRLRVWDLAQMRRQLANLKLDWDNPPFPIGTPESGPPPPLEVVESK